VNEADLYWLVGLCEGEATFDAHKGRYPRIRISMCDRDTVGRAATLMGCRVRLTLKPAPFSALWSAEIQGPRAAELMRLMLPHLGARRSAKVAEILGHTSLTQGQKPGPRVTRPPGLADPVRVESRGSS
jgi:hypothetical protein